MAIQYTDTVFSENMPVDKAIEKMNDLIARNIPFQALHVGTDRELTERKMDLIGKSELQKQIDDLKEQFERANIKPVSKLLHIPTEDQIKEFMK